MKYKKRPRKITDRRSAQFFHPIDPEPLARNSIEWALLILKTTRGLVRGYSDPEWVAIAFNCNTKLFRSQMDALIDAKYLAAIRAVLLMKEKGHSISDLDLYQSWIFFKQLVNPPLSPLVSMASYDHFLNSWSLSVRTCQTLLCARNLRIDNSEPETLFDKHQLTIDFK